MDQELAQYLNIQSASLTNQLMNVAQKVQRKYDYYNADNIAKPLGISMPVKMQSLTPGVGWASRAVTTLSDRLKFDGFMNDSYGLNTYFDEIYAKPVIDGLKTDALIAGCSFALLNWNDKAGRYMITPFTAQEATGVIDRKTGLLRIGMAVLKWGNKPIYPSQTINAYNSYPKDWIITTPQLNALFVDGRLAQVTENPTGRNMMQAFTHRANTDRPLGKSRISKTVRRIVDEMERVKQRQEVAEEFYSTPQRYINGLANGADVDDKIDLAIGKILKITRDEDGEKPDIGQLGQMSISGFTEAKKDLARDFCAETGLTLRNLGYETSNPTSAESLKTMSDDLLLEAQECQHELGEQIKQLAITLRVATDNNPTVPDSLKRIEPVWKPIFQTDVGAMGDAAYKIIQAMPELAGTTTMYRILGMSMREIEELRANQTSGQQFTSGNTQENANGGTSQ